MVWISFTSDPTAKVMFYKKIPKYVEYVSTVNCTRVIRKDDALHLGERAIETDRL